MIPRFRKWLTAQRSLILSAIGILLFYLGMFAVGITCPIKYLTGVSCAGCGMSRAWFRALTLDFAGAVHYHPLFWIVPIFGVLLWLQKKHRRTARIAIGVLLAAMLIVYCIRMADPTDTIVVFAPTDGLVYRIGHFLISQISEWLRL